MPCRRASRKTAKDFQGLCRTVYNSQFFRFGCGERRKQPRHICEHQDSPAQPGVLQQLIQRFDGTAFLIGQFSPVPLESEADEESIESGKPVWVMAHQARTSDWDPIQRISLGPSRLARAPAQRAVMSTGSTGRTHGRL